ncbi:hypothetical protein OESDEN_12625 [Oesophagostomum dentatum]|uniref:DNA helicase Pif1-like 2B domain-containing protein n=1 Tax=Oesophagostomum dentatum TaxID=61180 RepID=A0A0B1SWQ5_OESDE|nr:hypothetical protein OESDEN_12625 [Oesophagostomum dentatum]
MRTAESGSSWCDFLMSVGNGEAEQDEEGRIQLPAEVISDGNLIDEIFGDRITDPDCFSDRAILAPRNLDVNQISEEALNKLPGIVHEYRSVDEIADEGNVEAETYPTEFLNSLSPAGLPPHILRLKDGAVIMLLRNLDVKRGLYNGTRLIATYFGRFLLGCSFASSERKGEFVLIPRIDN